ncbi:MAG: leucine-rich repeat protein, partial [Bacilli bacterium]|nr:leucine-rich repeat protein [Bacilli bacterium]
SLYEGDTNVSNGTFASATTSMDVAPYQVFEVDDEKTYNLYIWIDETGIDQSAMMGQTFKATIKAEGETYWTSPESDFTVTEAGVLTAYNGSDATVVIPPVVNDVTVTEISSGESRSIFFGDEYSTNTIVIPDTVTKVGDYAFYMSGVNHVFIPNSVTTIGKEAFLLTTFDSITVQGRSSKPSGFGWYWDTLEMGWNEEIGADEPILHNVVYVK